MDVLRFCCGTRARGKKGDPSRGAAPRVQFKTDKLDQVAQEAQAVQAEQGKGAGFSHGNQAGTPTGQARANDLSVLPSLYDVTFDKQHLLGSGHFADVFKGYTAPSAHGESKPVPVAAKRILRSRTKVKVLQREIAAMLAVRDIPGVVRLFDVFYDKTYMVLIMEYMEGGELFERIVSNGRYSERDASMHVRMIATALDAMHSAGVVHRDLKPENLILCTRAADSPIKIADFGLSRILADDESVMHTICGTRAYAAPEVNFTGAPRSAQYTSRVDMWSLGVILFVILSGYHPFDEYGNSDKNTVWDRICKGRWSFNDPCWKQISRSAMDLIEKLIEVDPEIRLSARMVLEHPWIKDFQTMPTKPLKEISNRSLRTFFSANNNADEAMEVDVQVA